jgi:predicted ATPase
MPENLRWLIERQFEQLAPEEQVLLEAASVAGKEFAVAAVAAGIDRSIDEVETWCAYLARRGRFVRACGTDAWPDGTVATHYAFQHDLYRETVYARVPTGQRVRWHRQIGGRLEAGYGARAQDMAVELATHFVQGRDTARAVQYLHAAGEQAVHRSAPQEAIVHFTSALELLPTLPATPERTQQELHVHMALGPALMTTKGYADPAVVQTYSRARALCQQVGETPQLFPALWGLWAFYHNRAEYQAARELGDQLLSVAQSTHDPAFPLVALQALGVTLFYLGEFALAQECLEKGVALYDPQKHCTLAYHYGIDPGVVSLTYMAWLLCLQGTSDQALQRSHEALSLARALSQPFSLAWATNWAAALRQFRREIPVVGEQANAAVTISTEHGFSLLLARAMLLQGWALAAQGDGIQGIAQIRQALATQHATGAELARTYWLYLLAEAYGKVGQAEEGLRSLAEAMASVHKTGERICEVELYRLKGELLLMQFIPDELQADTCFQHALAIARRQQTKALELRTAMGLSRMWLRQGKRAAAWQLLADIYGWFTEGFDTADLQEARVLLATLEAWCP